MKKIFMSIIVFLLIVMLKPYALINYFSGIEEISFTSGYCFAEETFGGIPNNPVLSDGMVPVKWNEVEEAWYITDINDYEWYNYKDKKWANVTLKDGLVVEGATEELVGKKVISMGSMFVWIPRYTYKNNGNESVSIYFSNGIEDYTENGYLRTPSFYYGMYVGEDLYVDRNDEKNELAGIWVAKFIASYNGNNIEIKPDKEAYLSDINTLLNEAKNMKKNSVYGLNSSQVTTHMMKASEWAGVAYLTAAIGEIPYINNMNKSGYAGSAQNSTYLDASYLWNTSEGMKGSTTNNITGIFDMSGLVDEYIAGIALPHNVSSEYYDLLFAENVKDIDKIDLNSLNSYKLALSDTMNWNNDSYEISSNSSGVLSRGGRYTNQDEAGIFAVNVSSGLEPYGFRPVILVYNSTEENNVALIETETIIIPEEILIITLQFSLNEKNWTLGKNLSELFELDAVSGKRAIDLYMIEEDDLTKKTHELNQSIVSIIKNNIEIPTDELIEITKDTQFGAGTYQFNIAIGGKIDDKSVFESGKIYKVTFGGMNLKNSNGAILNIAGIELNGIKVNVL